MAPPAMPLRVLILGKLAADGWERSAPVFVVAIGALQLPPQVASAGLERRSQPAPSQKPTAPSNPLPKPLTRLGQPRRSCVFCNGESARRFTVQLLRTVHLLAQSW